MGTYEDLHTGDIWEVLNYQIDMSGISYLVDRKCHMIFQSGSKSFAKKRGLVFILILTIHIRIADIYTNVLGLLF
mgnify:CR=1 FL=1